MNSSVLCRCRWMFLVQVLVMVLMIYLIAIGDVTEHWNQAYSLRPSLLSKYFIENVSVFNIGDVQDETASSDLTQSQIQINEEIENRLNETTNRNELKYNYLEIDHRPDDDKGDETSQRMEMEKSLDNNDNDQSSISTSRFAQISDIPVVDVHGIRCDKLIQGDQKAINDALSYQQISPKVPIPDSQYVHDTYDCETFRRHRRYVMAPVSQEEADFPIAFSILLYKDVEQFERLLRAIYRPQSYYCVHVDQKRISRDVQAAVGNISRCFDNVFMASRQVVVSWGTYSVLEPELICMEDLWKYKKWKYFINLTGQEFPLKTNLDIVQILKVFNGSNNMDGSVIDHNRYRNRTNFVHVGLYQTKIKKSPPPVNVTMTKGSVHITATRGFVDYVLHDKRAQLIRDWVKDTAFPEERFFSSLDHSPQLEVPGAYLGEPETNNDTYPYLTRFKNWYYSRKWIYPCTGKNVRNICIFGVGDLKLLSERQELFANKFHLDYQPLALDCMEQLHFNHTREEIAKKRFFNAEPYRKYDFVWNHV